MPCVEGRLAGSSIVTAESNDHQGASNTMLCDPRHPPRRDAEDDAAYRAPATSPSSSGTPGTETTKREAVATLDPAGALWRARSAPHFQIALMSRATHTRDILRRSSRRCQLPGGLGSTRIVQLARPLSRTGSLTALSVSGTHLAAFLACKIVRLGKPAIASGLSRFGSGRCHMSNVPDRRTALEEEIGVAQQYGVSTPSCR